MIAVGNAPVASLLSAIAALLLILLFVIAEAAIVNTPALDNVASPLRA